MARSSRLELLAMEDARISLHEGYKSLPVFSAHKILAHQHSKFSSFYYSDYDLCRRLNFDTRLSYLLVNNPT
jgi:hypothetical protein